MKNDEKNINHSEESEVKSSRENHPKFIRKKRIRVKVQMQSGLSCFGDCHVIYPDGRVSDVINDERPFLILTDATVEGQSNPYDILTLNKQMIEFLFEIHRKNPEPSSEDK